MDGCVARIQVFAVRGVPFCGLVDGLWYRGDLRLPVLAPSGRHRLALIVSKTSKGSFISELIQESAFLTQIFYTILSYILLIVPSCKR